MPLTATISLNTVDVRIGTLQVSDTINGRRSASFDVFDTADALGGVVPDGLVGKVVEVTNGATVQFAGFVKEQAYQRKGNLANRLSLSFTCVDFSAYADRHVIYKVYENMSMRGIIEDVITFAGNGTETLAGDGVVLPASIVDSAGASTDGPTFERFIIPFWTAAQVFDELAKRTGYAWLIDYDMIVKFRQAGTPAPFGLGDATGNFRNLQISTSDEDYRNEQWIIRDIALSPAVTEIFQGDGSTATFFTARELGAIPTITRRSSISAGSVLSFAGLPADGETVTVDGYVYTFRDALTLGPVADEILTGATEEECARNLAYAINGVFAFEGSLYSWGTVQPPTCSALIPTDASVTVRFTEAGLTPEEGNGTPVSETIANAAWSSPTLEGGLSGVETSQTVGVYGQEITGSHDWYWLEGTLIIHMDPTRAPLAVGESILVEYRSIFSNYEVVRDQAEVDARALVDGTTGVIAAISQDSTANDAAYARSIAEGFLRKYGKLPRAMTYETDDIKEPLGVTLRAGMSQTINVTRYGINQSVLIESIESSDVGGVYMKRQIKGIGFPAGIGEAQGSWVDFLADHLGSSQSLGGGAALGSDQAQPATGVKINGIQVTF